MNPLHRLGRSSCFSRRGAMLLACALPAGPWLLGATPAHGYVTWHNSLDTWQSATVDDVVAVTFGEAVWPSVLSQDLAGVERGIGPTAASVCIGGVGAACFDLLAVGPLPRSWADAGS